jgi:hypothetical protein
MLGSITSISTRIGFWMRVRLRERAEKLWIDRQPRIATYVADGFAGRLGFGFEGPGRSLEGGVNGAGTS